MSLLTIRFLGNSAEDWLYALGVALVCLFVFNATLKIITRRLRVFAEKTKTEIDDFVVELLRKTSFLFLLWLSCYVGSFVLTLSAPIGHILQTLMILALLLQGAGWGNIAISFWLRRAVRTSKEEDAAKATTLGALEFVGKILLWSVVLLLALDNMGISITGLIAGLGVGGIAVALALQNILGDLFASLSIVLDKPFVIGDFILVDQHLGTVEHIGLKTTRLRSLSGEQIICSNADLLKSRIRNYKRMYERRIEFSIGVTYRTSYDALSSIPGMIRQIVEGQQQTRFDRAHFSSYGDSALLFAVVYFVTNPDYNTYMDIQQAINLAIYRRFADAGIEFAYPTRTLIIQGSLPDAQVTTGAAPQTGNHA